MELKSFSNDVLLERLKELVRQEREDTAAVVEHLAEVDSRDFINGKGYSSLFVYAVKVLGYSEPSAYHRIRAARAIKKKPELLPLLKSGELHLQAIVMLHPHLDDARADELVQEARGKTKREVEAFLAPLSPRPEPQEAIRIIAVQLAPDSGMPLFEPPAPAPQPEPPQIRAEFTFTAGPLFLESFNKAKGLLWHKFPAGGLEDIFMEALQVFLLGKDPMLQPGRGTETHSAGRHIPKWLKRQVWKRDKGSCVYAAPDGHMCGSQTGLEFDHIVPWARGGSSNDPLNIRLLCRAHNQFYARETGLNRPGRDSPPGDCARLS